MKKVTIFVVIALVGSFIACSESETETRETKSPVVHEGTIAAVGDSLTEGQGVDEEFAYPSQLEKKLQSQGYHYRVINAGISGETSSGTLARVNWILTLKPDIVILVTGANDGFRGIDPALIKTNIRKTITALREKKVIIVLGGMQVVQNLGQDYTTAFANIYPEIARKENIILIPFFLKGVAAVRALNQPDGIHPTKEGYSKIVETIYPYVIEAIEKHRAGRN
jgi:acyl-CoA thioesterase-1